MGVYRIDPDGSLHRIVADAGKPNGILVSPDQKTLYVVSHDNGLTDMGRVAEGTKTHPGRMALLVYDLAPDGSAVFRKTLIDYSPQDGPDGLVADVEGNLYVAVRETGPNMGFSSTRRKRRNWPISRRPSCLPTPHSAVEPRARPSTFQPEETCIGSA